MRWPSARWRQQWWVWALPLAFSLANAGVLFVHPGRSGSGFALMRSTLQEETASLRVLRAKKRELREIVRTARKNRVGVRELYKRRFSTPAKRLTALLAEFHSLADRAGLETPRLSYPEQSIDEFGLVSKAIQFQVTGTYAQLRTLMNLLEVSSYFFVLEEVRLTGKADSDVLNMTLTVSTLFASDGVPAPPAPAPTKGAS